MHFNSVVSLTLLPPYVPGRALKQEYKSEAKIQPSFTITADPTCGVAGEGVRVCSGGRRWSRLPHLLWTAHPWRPLGPVSECTASHNSPRTFSADGSPQPADHL